jgi:hypothetical protein
MDTEVLDRYALSLSQIMMGIVRFGRGVRLREMNILLDNHNEVKEDIKNDTTNRIERL